MERKSKETQKKRGPSSAGPLATDPSLSRTTHFAIDDFTRDWVPFCDTFTFTKHCVFYKENNMKVLLWYNIFYYFSNGRLWKCEPRRFWCGVINEWLDPEPDLGRVVAVPVDDISIQRYNRKKWFSLIKNLTMVNLKENSVVSKAVAKSIGSILTPS